MDSTLTSIVGPCYFLGVRVLQLSFLFLHRPVKLPWWSRFNEMREATKSLEATGCDEK
jgi:hypothetical protein